MIYRYRVSPSQWVHVHIVLYPIIVKKEYDVIVSFVQFDVDNIIMW